MSCELTGSNPTFIIDIALHVFILFFFLTNFFVFYISKLTVDAFEHELGALIEDAIKKSKKMLNPTEIDLYKKVIKNIPLDTIIKLSDDNSKKSIAESIAKLDQNALKNFTPEDKAGLFDTFIKMYSKPNKEVSENNKWLYKILAVSNGFLLAIIITSIVMIKLTCNQCVPIKYILIENLLIFLFVGIVEFLFFTQIAFKYIPIQPSMMINTFIDKLKKIMSK